jgi:dihydroflavonol-4-reductase
MTILVTGGTGFLGSEIVKQLVAGGHEVRVLRRKNSPLDLLGEVSLQVRHCIGDITDPESLERAFEDVDAVFHTAAYVSFGGKKDADKLNRVNVKGTANVVNACLRAKVKRLMYTSSVAAFGRPDDQSVLIDEKLEWKPSKYNTFYAESKYLGELEVHRGIAEGLDAVILNPSLIFGVGRKGDNTMQIIDQVRYEKLPGCPAGGSNVVDVLDVANAHILAWSKGVCGQRYFLGSENMRWTDIIATLGIAFNVDYPSRTIPPFLAKIAAIGAEFIAFITQSKPLLSKETAKISGNFYRYTNLKAQAELGASFRSFEETAHRIAKQLR